MTKPIDVQAELAKLRHQYRQQLSGKLQELELLLRGTNASISATDLATLHFGLHRLAGSGGTFGYEKLSKQASLLEAACKAWLDKGEVPPASDWAQYRAGLIALRHTIGSPTPQLTETPATPLADESEAPTIRLVLIEDDFDLAAQLCLGLANFGYEVAHFVDFTSARADLLATPAAGLIVDIMLDANNGVDGTVGVTALFTELGYRLPTMMLTARSDFDAKLLAARAKADAFVEKPIDIPTLADRVESMLKSYHEEPFRILIVDDDAIVAEYYRLTLIAAGMVAERVVEPRDVPALIEFLDPDLLLLDLYMPGCSGAELARAIRYNPAWQSLPITYLSAEIDLDRQVEALASGADDFLTKPISAKRLVASVRSRARRARKISELMSRDSLTGLLKHASIKESLAHELARTRREGKALVAVMVDIDHFKQVNDNWGHPIGDQVIKTLAHILRRRLRAYDSVGRYGGEEFAAVLPACSAEDAKRLLDDIREDFGKVCFTCEGNDFTVTLSAGIASSVHHADAASLLAAADRALYVAKRGGRNRVRVDTTS